MKLFFVETIFGSLIDRGLYDYDFFSFDVFLHYLAFALPLPPSSPLATPLYHCTTAFA